MLVRRTAGQRGCSRPARTRTPSLAVLVQSEVCPEIPLGGPQRSTSLARKKVVLMAEINPYAKCPCGSGKAFKWCCQAMFTQIVQAFELDNAGQQAAALKLMDEVIAQNPTNPEAWGRKALLLAKQGQIAESEKVIDKALEIRADYPFGLYLKAQFRFAEEQFGAALVFARRAAEITQPDDLDVLGNLYTIIVNCELHLNHPLAVRAG